MKADKETEDSDKLFSSLIDKLQEIQSKLKSNIDEKLRKSQESSQMMIEELQKEVEDLQMKHSQLEELSQSEDHLQLLQVSQPGQSHIKHGSQQDNIHVHL